MMRVDEFRDALDEALGSSSPPSAVVREAVRKRTARRRAARWATAAIALIVALGAAGSLLAWSRREGRPSVSVNQPSNTTVAPRSGWQKVANPPYPDAVAAVRAGSQVILAFDRSHLRFASFDPVAHTWAKLPKPPLDLQAPFTDSPTLADADGSIIVWGHAQARSTDTFAGSMRIMEYRPKTGTWFVLPDPPIHSLVQATPIWTGKELIVWGGNDVNDVKALAFAFDPARHEWRALPAGPLRVREDPVAVWTGQEMIVWGGFRLSTPRDPNEGAAFNPRTNTWRVLPPSGLSERELAATAWTGRQFLVWGGSGGDPQDPADGAAYDAATNRWHQIAPAPIPGRELAAVAWTGQRLFVWGGISFNHGRQTVNDGATYDPTTNTWSALPRSPLISRWGAVTIWTGSEVLVVEGRGPSRPRAPDEPALPDAAVYRPAEAH